MGKLTKLFREVEGTDVVKQKYYAEKIVESLMVQDLMEGKVFDAYNMEEIEKKIFSEAIKKNSLNESLKFVEGIEKQIDEGFGSFLKGAWNGVKNVAKKIKDAVTSWWNGKFPHEVDKAVGKWEVAVKAAKAKLESVNSSGVKESMVYGKDTSYMLDSDLESIELMENALAASQAALDAEENDGVPQNNPEVTKSKEDISKIATAMVEVVGALRDKTNYVFKTGFGVDGFKMYKVEKVKQTKVLSFGDDEATMVPVVKVIIGYPFTLTVPTTIEKKGIDVIRLLVTTISKDPAFKFDEKLDKDTFKKYASKIIIKKGGISYLITKKGVIRPEKGAVEQAVPATSEKPADSTDASTNTTTDEKPDDDVTTATAKETPAEKKSDDNKLIDTVITLAKSKGVPADFYERLNTTPDASWSSFEKFAGNGPNDHNPVRILANSGKLPPPEMTPEEYAVYLASLPTIISGLLRQAQGGVVPTQYTKRADKYIDFLEEVGGPADEMAPVILKYNFGSGKSAQATHTPAQKTEPTAKAPKTEADEKSFLASLL